MVYYFSLLQTTQVTSEAQNDLFHTPPPPPIIHINDAHKVLVSKEPHGHIQQEEDLPSLEVLQCLLLVPCKIQGSDFSD